MTTRLSAAVAAPTRRVERQDLRYWGLGIAGVTLLAILSLIYLAQASAVSTLGYNIKALENEESRWQAKNDQLRLKIAELRSLNRVEKDAAARLGMGEPQQIVYAQASPLATAPRTAPATARDSTRDGSGVTSATMASANSVDEHWWERLTELLPFEQHPTSDAAPD